MATLEYLTVTSCGQDNIFRSAVVCDEYRYELRLCWGSGPRLVAVGLNPPGGNDLNDSPTVSVLYHYAKKYRFAGLVMINLFAYKATKPAHLFAASRMGKNVIGEHNDFVSLKARIDGNYGHPYDNSVVVCWGKHGTGRGLDFLRFLGDDYVFECVKCFGVNLDGSPVHPLHKILAVPPLSVYHRKEWFHHV